MARAVYVIDLYGSWRPPPTPSAAPETVAHQSPLTNGWARAGG
jgi:hypothetical protein